MRPLLPVTLAAALLFVGGNLCMAVWSHRLPYYHMLEKIRTARDPNVLFVGNSLLAGLDEPALELAASQGGVRLRSLNTATPASQPPEHKLLFQYAARQQPGIGTLVVGIFAFQLTVSSRYRMADVVGNRMVAVDHRFSYAEVVSAYNFGLMDRVELEMDRTLPMLANRANAWKYVELLRRSMSSMGMPRAATNSMGRVDDFKALESMSPDTFDAEALTFLQHPDHFNPSYQYIFDQAGRAGMNIVIVVMPISPYHRAVFYSRLRWKEYLAAMDKLSNQRHIQVIDASGWLPAAADFKDHVHMTNQAIHVFSQRLGSELAQMDGQ